MSSTALLNTYTTLRPLNGTLESLSETTTTESLYWAGNETSCSSYRLAVDVNNIDCILLNLNTWVGAFNIVAGTICHCLCIYALLSTRSFRTQSFGVYTVALSIAGILALYTGQLRWVVYSYTAWEIDIRSQSEIGCLAVTILTYFSLQFIAWLQATIALDRVFHVAVPLWKPSFSARRCRWLAGSIVVVIELIFALAVNSSLVLLLKYDDSDVDKEPCGFISDTAWETWSWADLMSFSFLPAAIVIICNLIIVIASHNKVISETHNSRMEKTRRSLTIMLTMVNLVFVLTTLPVSIVQLINSDNLDLLSNTKLELARTVCYLLQYMGTASTFVIYCISGSKFRKTIRRWKIFGGKGRAISRTTTSRSYYSVRSIKH